MVCKYCGRNFKTMPAYYAHKCEGYVEERKNLKKVKEEAEKDFEYTCNGCGRHFKTKTSLRSHARFCENYGRQKYDEEGKYISQSKYKVGDHYQCECGKIFVKANSLNAHLSHCRVHHEIVGTEMKKRPSEIKHSMNWENKTPEEIAEIHKKSGESFSKNLSNGTTTNKWVGKKHTAISKQHHRESAIKFRETILNAAAAYNKKACDFIDRLNKGKNWNLQHAMNGGEVKMFGYYLDGYDKDLNIVFEYDEPRHYVDVYNNILSDKDIQRQNYIIENLHCDFYRYNEKLGYFYKVDYL